MRNILRHLLCEPGSNTPLELEVFNAIEANGEQDVIDGILYRRDNGEACPVISGVPIMIKELFPRNFRQKYSERISELKKTRPLQIGSTSTDDWSFSAEWKQHFDQGVERTWGWTVSERLEQLLMELQVDRSWCQGKRILDAGCGSGDLSEEISKLGAEVIGIDFSSSVIRAEAQRDSPSVHFLRGDLLSLPLKLNSFDAVISIGVLHHTPDTRRAFDQVARLVKPGGRFYVWLYRKPEGIIRRYIRTPLFDVARSITTRMPKNVQNKIVKFHAHLVRILHRCCNPSVSIPFEEYLVAAYDDLTPRWRHYHDPIEVSRWYHENGYSSPVLSRWDNPYGFGLVAVKVKQEATAGIHYGSAPKLWDPSQTIIG
jgi:ubiquinone/menaquinone biosynthesis C-methylase UbiE/uncharacterized protein YbaR (Trm112 family)